MSILAEPGNEPITIGNTVELGVAFTEEAGAPTEPGSVTLELLEPGAVSPKTIAPSKLAGVGKWGYSSTPSIAGRWWFRFLGQGVAAVEGTFVMAKEKV